MKYKVVLIEDEEGVAVTVPGLPGCYTQGQTREEALDNARDAIREYIAAGEETYQPDAEGATVSVAEVEL